MEQAKEYMEYGSGYILLDVTDKMMGMLVGNLLAAVIGFAIDFPESLFIKRLYSDLKLNCTDRQ